MDDDWEKIADEEPKATPKIPVVVNKWAGEDEDDPKESWEDALEDEKKDEEKHEKSSKPKKTPQQRIEEKKEKARQELEEKRRKEVEDEEMANLTPEERIRLRALQEEEYTRAALDTLGLTSSATIDSFNPKTKEEFTEFGEAICKKVSQFKNKEEYITFLDELVRNLCAGLSSTNIRKVKTSLDNLFLEKQKMEKGDKPKKKPGAGKVKARLRVEDDDDYASRATLGGTYEDDDYDDFM